MDVSDEMFPNCPNIMPFITTDELQVPEPTPIAEGMEFTFRSSTSCSSYAALEAPSMACLIGSSGIDPSSCESVQMKAFSDGLPVRNVFQYPIRPQETFNFRLKLTSDQTTHVVAKVQENTKRSRSKRKNKTPPKTKNQHTILQPLTPFNFFYMDERERLIEQAMQIQDHVSLSELPALPAIYDEAKMKELLAKHWHRGNRKRRKHRKLHCQIDFSSLSCIIARRWRSLDEQGRQFYNNLAALDLERYSKEKPNDKEGIDK